MHFLGLHLKGCSACKEANCVQMPWLALLIATTMDKNCSGLKKTAVSMN
jgi:hypothetical protein